MKIRFRYCGSCNPQLDLARIEERVREESEAAPREIAGGPLPEGEAELCILLNGCPVGCAEAPPEGSGAVRRLLVRGWKADGQANWTWEEEGGSR